MHTAALIALGLVLFLITFVVLALARAAAAAGRRRLTMAVCRPHRPPPHRQRRSSSASASWSPRIALAALAAILWSLLQQGPRRAEPRRLHHVDAGAGLARAACATPSSARS